MNKDAALKLTSLAFAITKGPSLLLTSLSHSKLLFRLDLYLFLTVYYVAFQSHIYLPFGSLVTIADTLLHEIYNYECRMLLASIYCPFKKQKYIFTSLSAK